MIDTVGMVGLFVAIGGQYALLFQIYRMMGSIQMEIATCPYHRPGRRPPGVDADE